MKALAPSLVIITALGAGTIASAQAAPPPAASPQPRDAGNVCLDLNVKAALAGKKAGDLLAPPQDVTAESGLATGRLYRIAYATTAEAGSVVASCGLIAVPNGKSVSGVVAWAHGTVGLKEECQPSMNPAGFAGPMPGGLGALSKNSDQKDGLLYNMLADGFAVVATDYPSAGMGTTDLQSYVLGVPSGLAVIDSARTLTANAAQFGLSAVAADAQLPLVTLGHSQGGGSSIWAGQLAQRYLSAKSDRTLNLVGVAAEAPASQFTTSPGQPRAYLGNHLGDRDMYNMNPGIKVFGISVPFPIGAALFSYVTVSWSQVDNGLGGEFPVGPSKSVDYRDVLSTQGAAAAPTIASNCLGTSGGSAIVKNAAQFLNPNSSRFFGPPFDGSNATGSWKGGIDKTCDNPGKFPNAIQQWCAWLQFNMPGPNGINPYSKLPRDNSGKKVPIYIAQGTNDRIIWCVAEGGMVRGTNCLTDQLFHSYEGSYCDGTGYLDVDYFANVDHFQVPAAASTNPANGTYNGSPLDVFVRGAMKGNLSPKCSIDPDLS